MKVTFKSPSEYGSLLHLNRAGSVLCRPMDLVSPYRQQHITGQSETVCHFPKKRIPDYTLIGESRYKGGQIDPQTDKAGHLPQAVENDTIFAPEAAGTDETPGYAGDEPDYEDEEIAGYMAGDDAGRATGVSFRGTRRSGAHGERRHLHRSGTAASRRDAGED